MPAFNAEKFVAAAIESVLNQDHETIELIIVNDGSTDGTEQVIKSFKDERIKYHRKDNGGVSSARNIGLREMQGDYFCFLDSDDAFPVNSISSRLKLFERDSKVDFVDGKIISYSEDMQEMTGQFIPKLKGISPIKPLYQLTDDCFFGITWMVKRKSGQIYEFDQSMTHGEDLLFFLTLAENGGLYDFTEEVIYNRREVAGSAMSNIDQLANGYSILYGKLKSKAYISADEFRNIRFRIKRIIVLSYLKTLEIGKALKFLIRTL